MEYFSEASDQTARATDIMTKFVILTKRGKLGYLGDTPHIGYIKNIF